MKYRRYTSHRERDPDDVYNKHVLAIYILNFMVPREWSDWRRTKYWSLV